MFAVTFKFAFWLALVFATVMALLPAPPALPASDKTQHMIAFAVLACLAAWAWPRTSLIVIGVRLSLFGLAIEAVQLIPALNRQGDIGDWLADAGAVAVIIGLLAFLRRRRHASASHT